MTEYKREIGVAVAVAILLAIVVGVAAIFYFPGPAVPTGSSSTGSLVSTQTSTVESRTLPFAETYTNATMALDPSLSVNPIEGLLQTSSNATMIAQSLASQLNELPINLVSQQLPMCSGNSAVCSESTYFYKTAAGSNITVTLWQGKFYFLDYLTQDYWTLTYGNATTTNTSFNVTRADLQVQQLMNNAFSLPLGNLSLTNQL